MSILSLQEFRPHPPCPQFRLRTNSRPPHHPTAIPPIIVKFHRHELHRWINLSDDDDGRVTRTLLRQTPNPSAAVLTQTACFHPTMFLLQDAAHRTLSPMLSALRLDLDPLSHYTLIDCVIQHARRASTSLVVADIVVVTDHVRDETELTRAAAAAAVEMESGMVPAGEHAVQEMLSSEKKAVVERDDEECVICMEELPRGSEVTRMPCGHWFHGDCIRRWLECSHYCPVCRFQMPT